MRTIDADALKENVKYACNANGDSLSLQWLNWFNTVIDSMPTVENKKNTEDDFDYFGTSLYRKGGY